MQRITLVLYHAAGRALALRAVRERKDDHAELHQATLPVGQILGPRPDDNAKHAKYGIAMAKERRALQFVATYHLILLPQFA